MRKRSLKIFKSLISSSIRVRQPLSWAELSDAEAWQVFAMLAAEGCDIAEIPLRAFLALNSITVLSRSGDGWLCSMPGGWLFTLDDALAAELAAPMAFLTRPADMPWRPERFRGHYAITAELYELTFADWLVINNSLQVITRTKDFSALDDLNVILMRRPSAVRVLLSGSELRFTPAERMAVFYWLLSYRDMLAKRYPSFFLPADPDETQPIVTPQTLMESNDALLRALTQGDATKEEAVMALPISRAFAELNARAREYAELKSKSTT